MRTLTLQIIISLCIVLSAQAGNRYWVASSQSNWNNSANWSRSSGGNGGASVPNSSDIAYFDDGASGNCIIDEPIDVRGIEISSDFVGTIVQSTHTISIGDKDFMMAGGNFLGGSGEIYLENIFQLDGGIFTSSSSTLSILGDFNYTGGVFFHNSGTIEFSGNGNKYFEVESPEPELYNVVVNLNHNNSLNISNKNLKVLNKLALLDGKLNDGKLILNDSCVIAQGYDDGGTDMHIIGTGNTHLIFEDGAKMFKNIFIDKSSLTDTVFVNDQTSMGQFNFGQDNRDLHIRKGVLSFQEDFTTDLNFATMEIEEEGVLNITDGTIQFQGDYINSGGLLDHKGGTWVFDGSSNQSFDIEHAEDNMFYNLVLHKGDNKRFTVNTGDTLYVKHNLHLENGKINDGIMITEGNVAIEPGFDRGTTDLVFGGSGAQTLNMNGSADNFDADIILNKSAPNTITLLNPLTINGNNQELILNMGIIISDKINILTIDDNSICTGGSAQSYIDGPILKIGNDAFEFPVGKNNIYAPVSISRPGNPNHSFRAEYFDDDAGLLYDKQAKDETLDHISGCEYWIVDRVNGDSEVEVTLTWDSPRSCGVNDLCDLSVARWDGSKWRDHGNGGTTGDFNSGSIVTGSNCSTPENVVNFSPFTLASSTGNNPLPVELIDFKADLVNGRVDIEWTTASEINNDHFEVERSTDALNWEVLAAVEGAGHSTEVLNYKIHDERPLNGLNYYRLKQVDFDGTFEYSDIATVYFMQTERQELILYPNPATTEIRIRKGSVGSSDLLIFNTMGQQFFPNAVSEGEEIVLNLSDLSTGMYMIKYGEASGMIYKQ